MNGTKTIRVLIVDDSLFFRTLLSNALLPNPKIRVVGTAQDVFEAETKIAELKPDVVTMDINMPKMNGIEFLKKQLPKKWMPVVVISTQSDVVFEAMKAGAVDFVEKPSADTKEIFSKEIAEKIMIAANATPSKRSVRPNEVQKTENVLRGLQSKTRLIALGASTGGTEATSYILKQLPASIPGLVIVQHMPPVFTKMYAQRLDRETKLSVKEAQSGDVIRPGHAYVAPGDQHILVHKRGLDMVIECKYMEKVNGHRPSVDVLFDSVANFTNSDTVGIILTGMGSDGANGLLKMKHKGAFTIGQDEKSCVVYGMPMVAHKIGSVVRQAPLEEIAAVLMSHLAKP